MNEELIDKYLNQSLNAEEEQQFLTLLKDEDFGRFLVRYCVEVYGYHATAAKMLEDDLEKNRNQWVDVEKKTPGKWSLVAVIAAAAVLAVSVIIFLPGSTPELSSSGTISIERHGQKLLADQFRKGDLIKGDESQLRFADGTQITLSGDLKINEIESRKEVSLINGTAFFTVAKQKKTPFKIVAGETVVEVVGTVFSVNQRGGETRVNVESGAVKVTNGEKSIMLHKGEKAIAGFGELKAELKNSINSTSQEQRDPDLIFEMSFDGEDPLDKFGLNGLAVKKSGQFVEGMLADSLALKDGLIEIRGSENDNFRIPMTLNAWVKVNEKTIYGPIMTKGDTSWRMQLSEDAQKYHGGFGLTDMNEFFNSESNVKTGMWQMVTLVYTDKLAMIYVDGKYNGQKVTELMHLNNKFPIQIGGNIEMPERQFKGLIDSVSIYKRALTEEEILLLYRRMIK